MSALAWIAIGAAAFFSLHTRQQIDDRRAALRLFETTARDAADALEDAQAGQQAYVALGQDLPIWSGKVGTFVQTAGSSIDALRSTAASAASRQSLLDASSTLTQFVSLDRRVREQLAADEAQAASLTIFSAAADAVSAAVSNVDTALGSERQAADEYEARQRRTERLAAGGGLGFAAFILLLLGAAAPRLRPGETNESDATADVTNALSGLSHVAPDPVLVQAAPPVPVATSAFSLQPLAELCTGFSRVRDAGDVKLLLEQAAELMHARGVIVWLGSTGGADLRPVLAHGYSDSTLARIPTLARSADNAAATAYRTGEVQVVRSRPGASQGAIVAPLLSADGCIGALTAEIRDREEERDSTRAVATILAAQLAGVLASAAEAPTAGSTTSRASA